MYLVPTPIQPDLAQAADDITEGIRAGEIVGLGVIVQLRGNKFFVDVFGRIVKDPHSARGWLRALDDCLKEIADKRKNTDTTK